MSKVEDNRDVPAGIEVRGIPGWPNYFAGDDGHIYSTSLSGRARRLAEVRRGPGRRYHYVTLCRETEQKNVAVHRTIALLFHGEPSVPAGEKAVTRHKDNNPSNNKPSNLEWGTQKQNLADRYRHGTVPLGEKNTSAKLTAPQVEEIRRRRAAGETCRDIAGAMGVTHQTIQKVATGRSWKHVAAAVVPLQREPRTVHRVNTFTR